MRTVRSLAASVDRTPVWSRFPVKALAVMLAAVVAAWSVFALVDRVVPSAAPAATPAADVMPPEKPRKEKPFKAAEPVAGAGPIAAIAGVLCAAVGAMLLLKRALKGSRHVPGSRKVLQVRDVLAMGQKRAIYLIGLEGRNLVVGLSGDQLTLLSEYSSEGEEAAVAAAAGARAEMAAALEASAPAAAPQAPSLDVEIGGDPEVEPAAAAPNVPAAMPARAFSFAAVKSDAASARQRAERVPEKFRQLLEQAAGESGR